MNKTCLSIIFIIFFIISCSISNKLRYSFKGTYIKIDSILEIREDEMFYLKVNQEIVSYGSWNIFYPTKLSLYPHQGKRMEFDLLKKKMLFHGGSIWLKK